MTAHIFDFNAEDRALLAEVDAVLVLPKNTPLSVAKRLYENTKKLLRQLRGLPVVMEARGLRAPKRVTKAEVRALVAQYPAGAPFEEIARWRRNGYSVDMMNAIHLGELARQVRSGYTGADFSGGFAANSPRDAYNGGAAADPTQSLRDDDDDDDFDWDNDEDWDQDKHERCAQFHRNLANQQASMGGVSAHHAAADLHIRAASGGSVDDSRAARDASKRLLMPESTVS